MPKTEPRDVQVIMTDNPSWLVLFRRFALSYAPQWYIDMLWGRALRLEREAKRAKD